MAKQTHNISSPNKNRLPITYFISRIELIQHHLDCPIGLDYSMGENKYKYKFSADINILKSELTIQVVINYEFSLDGHILLYMQVANDFTINNLLKILVDDKINDNNFNFYLITISINHARGIQATIIKDSPISTLYMPDISKEKVLNKITQQVV